MAIKLSVVVAGLSWSAYVQVKRATLVASQAHLDNATQQISTMFDSAIRRVRRELAALVPYATAAAAFRSQGSAPDKSVLDSLEAVRARLRLEAVSLWSARGQRLATAGSEDVAQRTGADAIVATTRGMRASRLLRIHDTLAYGVVFTIGSTDRPGGYIVGSSYLEQAGVGGTLSKLLAPGARLLIGNADGGPWTNLDTVTNGPPQSVLHSLRGTYTDSLGAQIMGVGSAVAATPWVIWVDAPETIALTTARQYLAEIVVAGALLVVVGALFSWFIIRRVMTRLDRVRRAAEALAQGSWPDPLPVVRNDEIGSLATSFNAMAERLRAGNEEMLKRALDLERRNREALESESRYRQLVDQSPDAVLVHRNGMVVFANEGAARMLRFGRPADLVGVPVLDLVDPESREKASKRIAAIETSRQASPLTELVMRRVDGSTLRAELSSTPIIFDGEPSIQTLARDMSERHLLEDQFRQAQKMEAVGRLAGGIAHDFNNLLTIINTYAELTLTRMSPDDPARQDIEDIRHAGMSAARLTRQMLAFSRKQVLNPRMLDINEAITGVTGMLARAIGDQANVVTELRPDLPPIWADAGQLEQVLMNLAVNAHDAMPNGGSLSIETAAVDLGEGNADQRRDIPPGRYVMLAVSDSGIGMTPDVKEHLFEPFFTTKQPGRGTGLGLATVYGIVKQSGGYIWVYSEPGHGTTFKIYFPQYAGEDREVPMATGEFQIPVRAAARILLVEDDPMVRAAVRRILASSPHHVTEAESGPDAIERFREGQGMFDLVITDMVMPGMTGADLIRELREWNPTLQAIIMSGYSEEATARDWKLPPNSVFLEKPVAPSRLLRAVSDALGVVNG
jgi:PAS domain S-box-containing protein